MTLNITAAMGPPKINKNASKSKKKSWRKNIDMTDAEEALGNFLNHENNISIIMTSGFATSHVVFLFGSIAGGV